MWRTAVWPLRALLLSSLLAAGLFACDDEAACPQVTKRCTWNPATQAYDRDCLSSCATDAGWLDAGAEEGGAR